MSDAQVEEVLRDYHRHVDDLRARLGDRPRALLDLNLHDGQVQSFILSPPSFTWRVLIGDLQRGYEFVSVRYDDAEVVGGQEGLDDLKLTEPGSEILYDELEELPEGRLIHRVLVWPEGEVWVRFSDVHIHHEPASPEARR